MCYFTTKMTRRFHNLRHISDYGERLTQWRTPKIRMLVNKNPSGNVPQDSTCSFIALLSQPLLVKGRECTARNRSR